MGMRRRNYVYSKVSSMQWLRELSTNKNRYVSRRNWFHGRGGADEFGIDQVNIHCEWHIKIEIFNWKTSYVFMNQRVAMFELCFEAVLLTFFGLMILL